MQTGSYEVHKLLKLIKANKFKIPQFQRDFRWSYTQIKLLIDSMARNYPMGSLLVMAKNPEVHMQSRSIAAEIADCSPLKPEDDISNDNILYVLDGQQRLTSIARAFLNGDKDRAFYFDLKEMISGFLNDNENTSWIKVLHRTQKNPDRCKNNRFIRADIAISEEGKTEVYIYDYIEDEKEFPEWKDDREKRCREAARIKKIFEIIRNYKVTIVVLDHDAGLESICRIFETINSTGIRLTTFDLAVATFYPKPDLRAKWEEALSSYPVLKEFEVDGERVLQVLVLRFSEEEGLAWEVSRSTQLKLKEQGDYVEKNWDEAIEALARAYKWAKSMGARPNTLTNHALLVAIGAHWCARPRLEPDHLLLKRWFFSYLLQTATTQAANYRIGRYFKALKDLAVGKTDREIIPTVYITPEILLGLTRDSRFKAVQCILSAAVSQDLVTGEHLLNKDDIEDHHIYPKAHCKRQGIDKKLCDSIVNRIAISKETNRYLADTSPEEYFANIVEKAQEHGTVEGLKSRLSACFIPSSSLKNIDKFKEQFAPAQFSSFMNARARLLWEEIRRVIGDSLVTEKPQGDDDDD